MTEVIFKFNTTKPVNLKVFKPKNPEGRLIFELELKELHLSLPEIEM
jgi:hypothetical protein